MDRIIIADSSAVFSAQLRDRLSPEVAVSCCDRVSDLLAMLREQIADLLVLDLSLPGCDGIELLHKITAMPGNPRVFVTVNYISDYLKSSLAAMGISYMLLKPCEMDVVEKRVREVLYYYRSNPVSDDILHKLGICGKLSGATYIRYAIPMLLEKPDLQLTKELYPAIGYKFDKRAQCIERSIRNAVHSAWENHDGFIWQAYFGSQTDGRSHRPSNLQFFRMLLDIMQNAG